MCLQLLVAQQVTGAEQKFAPPVLLFAPALRTPIEAAGTGLAPKVEVSVTIAASGKVSQVEIQSIEPSSEHDDLFAQLATDTLSRWRYAPDPSVDRPEEVTLTWTVQFRAIDEQEEAESLSELNWRRLGSAEQKSTDFRQKILSMPIERRSRLLTENAAIAHSCLQPESITKFSSPRFIVYTDAPSPEVAGTLGANL